MQVLLPFARIAAFRTRNGFLIAMAKEVPLQRASMRELQPTHLTNVGPRGMRLLHMEPVSALLFKLSPAEFT